MASDELHPPVGIDQTGFLSFNDMTGRLIVRHSRSIGRPIFRAPILAQPFHADALRRSSFLRGQRCPSSVIASQVYLPLFFGGCSVNAGWTFLNEALSRGACSRNRLAAADALHTGRGDELSF